MKFLNFKSEEDKLTNISTEQMSTLLQTELKANKTGEEIYVSMVHPNFENNGNRLLVINPINFHDHVSNKTYKYESYFLDDKQTSFSGRCGMYLNLDIAKFEADLLYGVQNSTDLAKKKADINNRISNIEDSLQGKQK